MEMNVTIFPVRLEWDEVNDKYMQQHYGFIPVTEIAKALDRTEEAIRMYAYKRLKIRSTRPHRQHQDVNKIKYRYKPRMNYWFSYANFDEVWTLLDRLVDAGFDVEPRDEGSEFMGEFKITGLLPGYCWPWEVEDE